MSGNAIVMFILLYVNSKLPFAYRFEYFYLNRELQLVKSLTWNKIFTLTLLYAILFSLKVSKVSCVRGFSHIWGTV
jgi:hypothetical protein